MYSSEIWEVVQVPTTCPELIASSSDITRQDRAYRTGPESPGRLSWRVEVVPTPPQKYASPRICRSGTARWRTDAWNPERTRPSSARLKVRRPRRSVASARWKVSATAATLRDQEIHFPRPPPNLAASSKRTALLAGQLPATKSPWRSPWKLVRNRRPRRLPLFWRIPCPGNAPHGASSSLPRRV